MSDIVGVLPPHLKESSIVTRNELLLAQRWVEEITFDSEGKTSGEDWLDNWLCTSLPFSFRYCGQKSSALLARWRLQKGKRKLVWTDLTTGLRLTWQIRTFTDHPAVEWMLWFENIGTGDTALIDNVQALDLRLNHSQPGKTYTIHGVNGGRSMPDDFTPFSWRIPSPTKRKEIQLGGDHPSSNRHLPFFNLETPEDRGVLVG